MNCWEVLAIDRTIDQQVIKRAYAKKLKQHHPEDDPSGFQNLRRAYEEALDESTRLQASDVEAVESSVQEQSQETHTTQRNPKPVLDSDTKIQAEQIMNQIVETYVDFEKRKDSSNWIKILDQDAIVNLEVKQYLFFWVFDFVSKNPFIPHHLFKILDDLFSWRYNHSTLAKNFKTEDVNRIFHKIHNAPWAPSYSQIQFPEGMDINDIEEYLNQRELVEYFTFHNDEEKVTDLMESMEANNTVDPEYCRLIANFHNTNQRTEQALTYYERCLAYCDQYVDAHLETARVYFEKGDHRQSARSYQAALAIDENNALALRGLAACYFIINNLDAATSLYEQALEVVDHDLEARIQLVRINQVVIRKGLKILEGPERNIEQIKIVAKALFDIGDYAKASSLLEKLKPRETSYDTLLLQGKIYEKTEEYKKANNILISALMCAQSEKKNGFEAKTILGKVYKAQGQYEKSIEQLTAALELAPYNDFALSELADTYRYTNNYDKALPLINTAIRINSNHWVYFSIRALILIHQEKYGEALPDIDIVLEHTTSFAFMYFYRGLCLANVGYHAEAAVAYQQAIDYQKRDAGTYLNLAKSLYEIEEYENAIDAIEQYKSNGGNADTATQLKNQYEVALRNLQQEENQ